jgi:formate dehydrogenase major subunit
MGLLNNSLPGYLNSPVASSAYATLLNYIAMETPAAGYWVNKPKFLVSLLKAWWGTKANSADQYQYLPKRISGKNYSFINLFESMYDKTINGLFCFGQNPVVGGPNANKESAALANLDWLVCVDLFSTETANFWKRPGVDYRTVNTEVFLLPVAASFEKEGSITNSGRWIQYRWKAAEPPGQAKSDLWIIYNLMQRIQGLYATSSAPQDKPVRELTWIYGAFGKPDIDLVAREINGYDLKTGAQLPLFSALTDDDNTASGCWIMCGMYPAAGNLTKRRDGTDPDGYGHYRNWSQFR